MVLVIFWFSLIWLRFRFVLPTGKVAPIAGGLYGSAGPPSALPTSQIGEQIPVVDS